MKLVVPEVSVTMVAAHATLCITGSAFLVPRLLRVLGVFRGYPAPEEPLSTRKARIETSKNQRLLLLQFLCRRSVELLIVRLSFFFSLANDLIFVMRW